MVHDNKSYKNSILIKNTQRSVKLNIAQIKKDVQTCLDELSYSDFAIGIWFTTPSTIQKYNAQYRHQNKPTDILSFSYHADVKPGKRIKVTMPEDSNLGDLIICPTYIQKKAAEYDQSFEERLRILLVHGICHLLGYDHETASDYKKMARLEKQLLSRLSQSKNRVD